MYCPQCQSPNAEGSIACSACGAALAHSDEKLAMETRTVRPGQRDFSLGMIVEGKYRILEELGSGGMGIVYLAEQIHPVKRRVALKIIKLGMDTEQVIARFESERQALAVMDHPNIAKVLDGGATGSGRPYFVMDLVRGIPINDYCDRHRLSMDERLRLFLPVCQAVQHAHQKGVIHRDLKPSNVLVTVQDDQPAPRIIDFGIAKATDHRLAQRTFFTEQGHLIGTPEYMSPEQAEMSALDVDTRTDIYSLGVMLYELVSGVLPFDPRVLRSAGLGEIQRIIRELEPPKASTRLSIQKETQSEIAQKRKTDPGSLVKELRGDLDWITMKAMAKDRTRRYPSASELAADLERHLKHEPVLAGPPSTWYRVRKYVKRHRLGVAAAALVIAAILAGISGATIGLVRAVRAERKAVQEAETAKQVSDFLVSLFEVSDPSESKGNSITAREILDRGAQKMEKQMAGQPLIQARLMDTMGSVYSSLGLYDTSAKLLKQALTLRQQTLGREHIEVATSLNSLGELLRVKGEHAAAEPLLREALALEYKLAGRENAEVADILNNLGLLFLDEGNFAASEPFLRDSLAMRRKLSGEESVPVAASLNNLAELLREKGDYESAEPLLRQTVAILRKRLGNEHPDVASTLNNLGVLLDTRGDTKGAEAAYRESLDLRRTLLGNEHPDVATSYNNLALLLSTRGDLAEAEPLYRQALTIHLKLMGAEHPQVAVDRNNLALLLQRKGDLVGAEQELRKALDILRQAGGEENPDTARSMHNLAAVLHDSGRLAEAGPLYRKALLIRRKTLPPGHFEIGVSLLGVGRLAIDLGDAKGAERSLREAVDIQRKAMPAGHWRIADAESALGGCLTILGRYGEAEPLLVPTYEVLKQKRGENDYRTRWALDRIRRLYQAWGKPDKAAQYRRD